MIAKHQTMLLYHIHDKTTSYLCKNRNTFEIHDSEVNSPVILSTHGFLCSVIHKKREQERPTTFMMTENTTLFHQAIGRYIQEGLLMLKPSHKKIVQYFDS